MKKKIINLLLLSFFSQSLFATINEDWSLFFRQKVYSDLISKSSQKNNSEKVIKDQRKWGIALTSSGLALSLIRILLKK